MNRIISKYTKQIRYKIILNLIKYITPELNDKIELFNKFVHLPNKPKDIYIPRPSINIIREYFFNKSLVGVEIGVNKGFNAEFILNTLNMKQLFLIDPYKNYFDIDRVWNNLDNMYERIKIKFQKYNNVKILREFSNIAVNLFLDDSLDFIYIDGNHKSEYVYQDIDMWYKKVKNKGIIAGHDIFNIPSVLSGVKLWCKHNSNTFYICLPDFYIINKK